MLFARGIILVEGDAEKFLVPLFAEALGYSLDMLGITVCSVAGTNFMPYAKFLTALDIPFSVITDWDPMPKSKPLAVNRGIKLAVAIERVRTKKISTALAEELKDIAENKNEDDLADRFEDFGIYTNIRTLETDLYEGGFADDILATLNEEKWSKARQAQIDGWLADHDSIDQDELLNLIDGVGKGRFAQRLASKIEGRKPPRYLEDAIQYVVKRV